MPVFNSNSVDLDQAPRSAASDQDLHSLAMSLLWDAKHKWIKNIYLYNISTESGIRDWIAQTSLFL